jgi:hypothetical protein
VTAQPEIFPFSRSIAGRATSPSRNGRNVSRPKATKDIVSKRRSGTSAIGAIR